MFSEKIVNDCESFELFERCKSGAEMCKSCKIIININLKKCGKKELIIHFSINRARKAAYQRQKLGEASQEAHLDKHQKFDVAKKFGAFLAANLFFCENACSATKYFIFERITTHFEDEHQTSSNI